MLAGLPLYAISGRAAPAEWAGLTPLVDYDVAHATAADGEVTALPDSSGNGNDATVALAPTYNASDVNFNGAPSMGFPGDTARRLTMPDPGIGNGGPFSIVVVAYTDGSTGTGTNKYAISCASTHAAIYAANLDATWRAWASADLTRVSSDKSSGTPSVLMLTLSGGTQRFYVNSTTASGTEASSGFTPGSWTIGNWADGPSATFALKGNIARVLVFGVELDAGQRAACMTALGAKYGITIA